MNHREESAELLIKAEALMAEIGDKVYSDGKMWRGQELAALVSMANTHAVLATLEGK